MIDNSYYEQVEATLKYVKYLEKQKQLLLLFYQEYYLNNLYVLNNYRYERYKYQYLQQINESAALVETLRYTYEIANKEVCK